MQMTMLIFFKKKVALYLDYERKTWEKQLSVITVLPRQTAWTSHEITY
jgi:hypothetical protein